MTAPWREMKTHFAPQIRLWLMIVAAAAVAVVAERQANTMLAQPTGEPLVRPDTVQFFHRTPSAFPSIRETAKLLLMGNSHTYALPGLRRGDTLRDRSWASRPVLIDDIASELGRRQPDSATTCYAMAYPNFLPYEMLTRVAHAYHHGFRPDIIVLGLTWRNIARDSQLRPEVRAIYKDEVDFPSAFARMLTTPGVDADKDVLDAIAADVRWGAAETEKARLRSSADQLDEAIDLQIRDRLNLLGNSAFLRARFNQLVAIPIQGQLQAALAQKHSAYMYDVVDHDLNFNLKCLWALLRLFTKNGARVVCYLAPERTDVQPLMDPVRESQVIPEIAKQLEQLGAVVLDARHVVPNEYWGYNGDLPDDSHFTEPGHEQLAAFLVQEMDKRNLLTFLSGRK
jgi:hypothetical protein